MFENALWFFSGAIAYGIFSYLLALGHSKRLFDETTDSILLLLDAINNDIEKAIEIKRLNLLGAEGFKDEVEKIIKNDRRALSEWRNVIVVKMLFSLPKRYHRFFSYTNWYQARQRITQLKLKKSKGGKGK
jgi:hypothetical protein